MAVDTRTPRQKKAAAQRAARKANKARNGGEPPTDAIVAPDAAKTDEVEAVNAVVVVVQRAENGQDIAGLAPIPQGDVRAAEMLHILKKAVALVERGI